jgi:hypothetical protein
MLPRTVEWFRRKDFPASAKAPLGWGVEYWDSDPTHYEGWETVRDRVVAVRHRRPGKGELARELSDQLLDDVLAAAGGVEHAIVSLRSVVAELQQFCDEHLGPPPVDVTGVGHPAATEAWYELANVLFWARTLEERLDRKSRNLPNQGLLPRLRPLRLDKRVKALVAELRNGPLGEARLLTNFILHQAQLRHPLSGAEIDDLGTVRLPIPDAQSTRISHWHVLTWSQHRDGIAYAEALWRTVEEFIDELLTAFERAVPKRLRTSPV